MKAVMVKHSKKGKTFWFGVPKELAGKIRDGVRVVCDTVIGKQYGFVVGSPIEVNKIRDVMKKSGAAFPLRMICSVECEERRKKSGTTKKEYPINEIKIPHRMALSKPGSQKLSKRFIEYYYTEKFNTKVVVAANGELKDGYTAYLVAKMLKLPTLLADVAGNEMDGDKADCQDYQIPEEIKEKIPDYFYYAFGGELVSVFGVDVLDKDCYGISGLDFTGGTSGFMEAFRATCKKLDMGWLSDYYDTLPWNKSDQFDSEISDEVLKRLRYDDSGTNPYYMFLLDAGNGENRKNGGLQ